MTRRFRVAVLALLLPACGDSCGCGEPGSSTAKVHEVSASNAVGSVGTQARVVGDSGTEPPLPPELQAMRNQLAPNEDEDERKKLERAAAAIDGQSDLGEPMAGARFEAALPDQLGEYRADGAAQAGTTPAEAGSATMASRRYSFDKSVMHVKITDTADAPGLRRELAQQLAMTGNAPTGHQRGRIEAGVPGVLAYHEEVKASRAMALLAGRYLVEVMVERANEEDAAWSAIEALDKKALPR